MAKRDDFNAKTKDLVAKRVAYRCSYPGCGIATIGPKYGDLNASINIGIACHICAAAPGGPRYDASMTSTERTSPENCIWMCTTHSVLIDKDTQKYSVELLRKWKKDAEKKAEENISKYQYTEKQLKDEASLKVIFDNLIKNGDYDILHMLIDNSKFTNTELLLRYEIYYDIYCNREALFYSIKYYIDNVNEKNCDEILSILIAHNISTGIEIILPFCSNDENKKIANEIIEGNIKSYLFIPTEELTAKQNKFKYNATIQKLLSVIIIEERFPSLPYMADGQLFDLYDKEFTYELLAHAWRLYSKTYQYTPNNEQPLNESYIFIKNSIKKVLQLDNKIQFFIWDFVLEYTKFNVDEFNYIFSFCPIFIKESIECKRIELVFKILHGYLSAETLLFGKKTISDEDSLLIILSNVSKEKRIAYLEENKYLLKRRSDFLYLWIISLNLDNDEINNNILKYKNYYKNDVLWNCLAAFYGVLGNPPSNLIWLNENKEHLNATTINLYIQVLKKYNQWDTLIEIEDALISPCNKYKVGVALMYNISPKTTRFCLDIFNKLEELGFYELGFFYNFSLLYCRISDFIKAEYYLEKECNQNTDETCLIELLKIRYRNSNFKFDIFLDRASKSSNSELLFLVSLFYEKKRDNKTKNIYLLKAIFSNPQNENALKKFAINCLNDGNLKSELDIGQVFRIENDTKSIKILLLNNNIVNGIKPQVFLDCIPVDCNADDFVGWQFYSTNQTVQYEGKEYTIKEKYSFWQLMSKFIVEYFLKSDSVTVIKGTEEETINQISQILQKQGKEYKRLFSIFNEEQGIFPVSFLANQLGRDYIDSWQYIITKNDLKIKNYSTINPTNHKLILTIDAIITFSLLNSFDDLNPSCFLLPNSVKKSLMSDLTDKISDIQSNNYIGAITYKENNLFAINSDNEQKKKLVEHYAKIRKFVSSIDGVDSNIYNGSIENLRNLLNTNNLVKENYTLGLAQTNGDFVIVTDEPFICVMCQAEKISHSSSLEVLFTQNLSCSKILEYLEQLLSYNFSNFFNGKLCKKIIDSALKENEENQSILLSKFRKWLVPEKNPIEHKQRVFNAYRELLSEDIDSVYSNFLSDIGYSYFCELYPEKIQDIYKTLNNSKLEIMVEPKNNDKINVSIQLKNKDNNTNNN